MNPVNAALFFCASLLDEFPKKRTLFENSFLERVNKDMVGGEKMSGQIDKQEAQVHAKNENISGTHYSPHERGKKNGFPC